MSVSSTKPRTFALQHSIRVRMLEYLEEASAPISVCDLAQALDLSCANAGYHAAVLRDARLVRYEDAGAIVAVRGQGQDL